MSTIAQEVKPDSTASPEVKTLPLAVFCMVCGAVCLPKGSFTGYGEYTAEETLTDCNGGKETTYPKGKYCYACASKRLQAHMHTTGRGTLYLTGDDTTVQDFTGHFKTEAKVTGTSTNNMRAKRRDVSFRFNGEKWHGVNIGDNEILRCKRIKRQTAHYEILNHGVQHNQYFTGCGTYGTEFQEVVTGAGDNAVEAYNDALEAIASQHDSAAIDLLGLPACPKRHNITVRCKVPASYSNEHYVYVGIRYNLHEAKLDASK